MDRLDQIMENRAKWHNKQCAALSPKLKLIADAQKPIFSDNLRRLPVSLE